MGLHQWVSPELVKPENQVLRTLFKHLKYNKYSNILYGGLYGALLKCCNIIACFTNICPAHEHSSTSRHHITSNPFPLLCWLHFSARPRSVRSGSLSSPCVVSCWNALIKLCHCFAQPYPAIVLLFLSTLLLISWLWLTGGKGETSWLKVQ